MARDDSNEQETGVGCCACLLYSFSILLVIVLLVVCSGLLIPKLVIGGLYFHDCEIQPLLPVFLIVDACVSILQNCHCQCCEVTDDDDSDGWPLKTLNYCKRMFLSLVGLFQVAWMVMGTIWVIQVKRDLADCKNIHSTSPFPVVSSPQPTIALPENLSDMNNTAFGLSQPTTALPQNRTDMHDNIFRRITTEDKAKGRPLILKAISSSQLDTMNTKSGEENSCKTCHHVLVDFSLVVVIVQWVVVGLCFIVMIICLITCCGFAALSNEEQPSAMPW